MESTYYMTDKSDYIIIIIIFLGSSHNLLVRIHNVHGGSNPRKINGGDRKGIQP